MTKKAINYPPTRIMPRARVFQGQERHYDRHYTDGGGHGNWPDVPDKLVNGLRVYSVLQNSDSGMEKTFAILGAPRTCLPKGGVHLEFLSSLIGLNFHSLHGLQLMSRVNYLLLSPFRSPTNQVFFLFKFCLTLHCMSGKPESFLHHLFSFFQDKRPRSKALSPFSLRPTR
jgi:hypothetical protein